MSPRLDAPRASSSQTRPTASANRIATDASLTVDSAAAENTTRCPSRRQLRRGSNRRAGRAGGGGGRPTRQTRPHRLPCPVTTRARRCCYPPRFQIKTETPIPKEKDDRRSGRSAPRLASPRPTGFPGCARPAGAPHVRADAPAGAASRSGPRPAAPAPGFRGGTAGTPAAAQGRGPERTEARADPVQGPAGAPSRRVPNARRLRIRSEGLRVFTGTEDRGRAPRPARLGGHLPLTWAREGDARRAPPPPRRPGYQPPRGRTHNLSSFPPEAKDASASGSCLASGWRLTSGRRLTSGCCGATPQPRPGCSRPGTPPGAAVSTGPGLPRPLAPGRTVAPSAALRPASRSGSLLPTPSFPPPLSHPPPRLPRPLPARAPAAPPAPLALPVAPAPPLPLLTPPRSSGPPAGRPRGSR